MLGGAIPRTKTSEEIFAPRRDAIAGSQKLLGLLAGQPNPPAIISLRPDAKLPSWVHKVERIKIVVAREFGISREQLISDSRRPMFVLPRQVVMYIARTATGHSTLVIGAKLGGRDHATILHGVRSITNRIAFDLDLAVRIEKIKAALA